jgi:hypothetical protein
MCCQYGNLYINRTSKRDEKVKGGSTMKKKLFILGISFLFLLSIVSAQETAPSVEIVPMGNAPTIDGVIALREWTDANVRLVELESDDGKRKFVTRYIKYADDTVYFALVVEGKSEEVFLWLGDDESQAWQKGTDIKRCLESEAYEGVDYYYRGLYDMVRDPQQDTRGAGIYDADNDETTVEIEIPFDSEDANDYRIVYDTVFTIIYGSIHRTSPDKEYKKKENVSVPAPPKTPPPHKDLDVCSCINVKVSASRIKHYLGGLLGYKSWTERIKSGNEVKRSRLAAINVEVSIKDITCCGKWRAADEIVGVTAKITCNTRYGRRTNSASVFRYMQRAGTQRWYNTAVSMTNIKDYIQPGTCTATVEANGKVCFTLSFTIV